MSAPSDALAFARADGFSTAQRVLASLKRGLVGWIVPLIVLALWAVAARYGWMPPQILPAPALVLQAAVDLAAQDLLSNLWISLQRLSLGLAGGVVAGVVLGAILGCSDSARRLVYPTFFALIQIPTLAWLPLLMIALGIGEALKLAIILKAVIVPVAIHTMVGLNDTQPKLRDVATVLRLPPHRRLTRLVLPTALPSLVTGLRLALSQAWISLLAVELLASSEGIGYLMVWGRQLFMLDIVFVCIVVIALVGLVMDRGIHALERALIRWPRSATPELVLPQPKGYARLVPWLLPISIVALWHGLTRGNLVDVNLLPTPATVLATLRAGLLDGTLLDAMLHTLGRAFAGLLIGGVFGLAFGLWLGLSRSSGQLLGPTFSTLRQVAVFAWVPLITAWFGIGEAAKIAFVSLAAFFPIFVAAHHGVMNRSPQLDEAARVLRLNTRLRLRVLILPGAASALFAGLHLGLTFSWLGAIGSEFFMRSGAGIGGLMINAQQLARMDVVISCMVLVGLAGAVLRMLGEQVEARATRWRSAGMSA